MILLTDLIVTQNNIRSPEQVVLMMDDMDAGRTRFTQENRVLISKVTSPKFSGITAHYFIHNGHHRLLARYLWATTQKRLNLMYLLPAEYILEHRTYDEYSSYAPENKYITPFHLFTECRKADFSAYRTEHNAVLLCSGVLAAKKFCLQNGDLYKERRTVETLSGLAVNTGLQRPDFNPL